LHELLTFTAVLAALMVGTTVLFPIVSPALRVIEQIMLYCSVLIVLFVMLFVGAEVVMRYGFNSPIPGHLEGSELLMPMIVFLAISYAQRVRAHVGMDLVIDAMPQRPRRIATAVTLLVSVYVCAVLAYFCGKNAYQLWLYDDVTMTPPYFKTWPSAASISVGYGLLAIRLYLQALAEISPRRFYDAAAESESAFHSID
jgi:TRAP-type C4-dicarboxylate transport system permease small subunit